MHAQNRNKKKFVGIKGKVAFVRLAMVFFLPALCYSQGIATKNLPILLNLVELPESFNKPGSEIKLEFLVKIPKNHKLTPGAPSSLTVFEKDQEAWRRVSKWQISSQGQMKNHLLSLRRRVRLRHLSSLLTFDLVLYHCSTGANSACRVTSYRGKIKRDRNESEAKGVDFSLELPKS